jgi:hypothetical protein
MTRRWTVWPLAIVLATALIVTVICVRVLPDRMISPDFIAFWTAGRLLASGHSPYDVATQHALGWDKATCDQGTAVCSTNSETITWTQRMSLASGTLTYKVLAGQSTTWGQFGQADTDLTVSVPCSASSLASYSADDSASRSTVSYGANRVTSMTLVQVRTYQNGTLLSTDTKARNVVGSN